MNLERVANTKNQVFDFLGKRPYLRLTIYILITSLLLYWQFIFGDKVFTFYANTFMDAATDTYHQYLKVYEFFANNIRNGELTSYTFQYGYGNSIFSMIGWISDPFSSLGVLVGVIFGSEYIYDSMAFIVILKHICTGLICLKFLREFKFSLKTSILVAYIYAFNGYITTLGEHYFFANNPVYLILILLLLEKVIKGEHKVKYWCGLLYVSALITAGGVTCAYEIFLAAGFYSLFRVIYIYGKSVKYIIQRLGICLAFVLGGIGISSFILFPMLDKILGSNRIGHSNNLLSYFSLSGAAEIKTSILRFFSNQLEGTFNDFHGAGTWYPNLFACFFSVMLIPIAAQFILHTFKGKHSARDRIFRMIPVGVVVFFIVDKFIPYMFSFFVGHYQSYAYVFLPMYAVMFADTIDNIKKGVFGRITNCITIFISLIVIVWGGATAYNKGAVTSYMWLIVVVIMIVFGGFALDTLYLSSNKSLGFSFQNVVRKLAAGMLTSVIVLNMFCENYITTNYNREIPTKDLVHKQMLTTDIVDNINSQEAENFFRIETNFYEGRMFWYSYPFMFPMRSTAYYDSSIDNFVPQFYNKMFDSSSGAATNYMSNYSKVNNTVTEDLLGIKYLILKSNLNRNGWGKKEEYPEQGIALYKNSNIETAGLLFDSYTTQDEADEEGFGNRALGMATRLILDDPVQNINTFASKLSSDIFPNSVFKEKSKNNAEDIINDILNIDSVLPYAGTVYEVTETEDGYNIQAEMDGEDSNFRFSLNTDTVNDFNKLTTISFRLDNGEVLKNFVYFDSDNSWKSISYIETENDGDETVYSFAVPQTASELAFCVNQACDLDIDISSKTIDVSGEAFNISTAAPYEGTITNINFDDNKYNVKAIMNTDESNFRFYLNTDVVNDSNSFSQISFRMKNSDVLKNFLYFDADNSWKEITNLAEQSEGEETVYTFTIPQAASCLALCVNKPCTLNVDISTKIFDISDSAFKVGTAAPYLGSVDNIGITDDGYNLKATMNGKDSNFRVYLNTDILNDSKKSTLITFKLKNNSVVDKFVYFDTNNQWKTISVRPTPKNDVSEYSFIIPQTASCLAMSVKKACKLDVDISVKTVTATYINEGIHLDNPKRGNIVTGTVDAQKNSLLYLPIPFNKYWNAYIDGEKVDIMKANYAFMAVPVTAGEHTVTFIYSNKTYHTFLKVSIAAFILYNGFFAFCFVVKYRRKRKAKINDFI